MGENASFLLLISIFRILSLLFHGWKSNLGYLASLCVPPSEIQALLLSDCLVLLQRGPDERLQLRYPSRWLGGGGTGGGDSKTSFSPLVKLDSLLVRSVATGNSFSLLSLSLTPR